MSRRNALFLLTLAALLFSFSVGVLVSRPVTAQSVVGYPGMPMRQSDLWCFVATDESQGMFPLIEGWPAMIGYGFSVAPDSAGRLPVLTQLCGGDTIRATLFRKGPDGIYRGFVWHSYPSYSNTFVPGVVLPPGDYAVMLGSYWGSDTRDTPVALIGYWARP